LVRLSCFNLQVASGDERLINLLLNFRKWIVGYFFVRCKNI